MILSNDFLLDGPCYIGVDPGVSGAFAVLSENSKYLQFFKYPGSCAQLREQFAPFRKNCILAVLEKVFGFPGMNVVAVTSFMKNAGAWEMLLTGIPNIEVTPRRWKARVLGSSLPSMIKLSKDSNLKERAKARGQHSRIQKAATVAFVNRRFPSLNLKKGQHNEADAVCMALYARDYHLGLLKR